MKSINYHGARAVPVAVVVECLGLKKGLIGKRLTGSLTVTGCEVKQTSRVRIPPMVYLPIQVRFLLGTLVH